MMRKAFVLAVMIGVVGLRGSVRANQSSRQFPADLPERQWVEFKAAGYDSAVTGVVYRSRQKLWCGMPLGGLATGCLDIDNNGQLGYCTIFSHVWGHDAGADGSPRWRDIVWASGDGRLVAKHVDDPSRGKMNMPFLGLSVGEKVWVLTTEKLDGVQTADEIEYWGHYPVADIEYRLNGPVQVGLRAWTPFIPGDTERSNVPGAVFEVHLNNSGTTPQSGTLVMSFPGPRSRETGGSPLRRQELRTDRYHGVHVSVVEGVGYVLATLGTDDVRLGGGMGNDPGRWARIARELPRPDDAGKDGSSAVAVDYALQPGQRRTVRFVLSWYAPYWHADFPYDGVPDARFTKTYVARYGNAREVADDLVTHHKSLLDSIVAWQSTIYQDRSLPPWLRDGLINIFHLLTECGTWAMPREPLGPWCAPEGVYSLVESSVADGQQSCIPCDWYGNIPLVYFYPDLARTTLRAYAHFTRKDGAVPFTLGAGCGLGSRFQHDRQRTLNGCCFTDLVGRLWRRTRRKRDLEEFYPAVKKSVIYMIGLVPGPAGVISTAGDQWYESMAWPGMSSHVGGVRLATLRLAEQMAIEMHDEPFAARCRTWYEQGSRSLEKHMWTGTHYRLFVASQGQAAGGNSDLVLSHQLDGQWIADLHGLPEVFLPKRVRTTLATIKRLNEPLTTAGLLVIVAPDGTVARFGGRMGGLSTMPASAFITAMNFMYAGDRKSGLKLARDCLSEMVLQQGMTWDMPNIMIGTAGKKQRVYGTDYYQCMSLWGLPAALTRKDIAGPCKPGGLVQRIIEAGKRQR